ncbi:MAG: terminase large subunit [Bacillota bacterium]|nr:terminase large subunit [Bacillota bacterium]
MAESRKGRQTPTHSLVIPYDKTYGQESVQLYNSTGREAQEWQQLLLCDMLAYNEDNLWTHTKYGYSVPRRNGKNEIVAMRELWGLMQGESIMHTAHRTPTSHSAWERLCELLSKAGFREGEDYKTLKQFGLESITMLKKEGKINFRTRSSKGGLGEGYDLLVIDEAQEYTDDQESALKYVVTSSKNPQTIFCGTPPTPVSSGTVFTKMRESALAGKSQNTGWAEWSVDFQSDVKDKELWYETNPSLGTVFTERSVADEIGTDDIDFNIQRLGLWLKYNQKSAITEKEWDEIAVKRMPKLTGELYAAVKYGHDGTNVSMAVAVKTAGRKIFVEAIDCRPIRAGNAWIVDYLKSMRPAKVVIDGANGQQILEKELKENRVKGIVLPTVKEVIVANALFEQCLFDGTICHNKQASLRQSVSNCEKRAIGSNGGFGFRSNKETVEVTLLESTILAFWACHEGKTRRKQKVSY